MELAGEPAARAAQALTSCTTSTSRASRKGTPVAIALRGYLTALFVAQSRNPGTYPSNSLPVNDIDTVSWVDLFATPSERPDLGSQLSWPTGMKLAYSSMRVIAPASLKPKKTAACTSPRIPFFVATCTKCC